MERVLETQRRDDRCDVAGVGVHVVTLGRLRRAAVAAAVVGDHAVALGPVLEEDLRAVLGLDFVHDSDSSAKGWR